MGLSLISMVFFARITDFEVRGLVIKGRLKYPFPAAVQDFYWSDYCQYRYHNPELIVSSMSSAIGESGLAVGNAIGSYLQYRPDSCHRRDE